jgi:hypothetical protein
MLHRTPEHALSERVVILSPRPHVLHVKVAIRLHVGGGVFLQTRCQPLIDGPVRISDRDVSVAVTVFREELSHRVAFGGRVAFFEQRETEIFPEAGKVFE